MVPGYAALGGIRPGMAHLTRKARYSAPFFIPHSPPDSDMTVDPHHAGRHACTRECSQE